MAGASPSELPRRAALGVVDTWRRLNFEQRVAGIGALLLIVSTFGPFSFVEAAIVLCGVSVLLLLRKRAEGREFHIPFGDGGVIVAAGAWSALLIVIRLFDRPLGQNLLALVCAAVLVGAGLSERRKRPPDDLPGPDAAAHQRDADAVAWEDAPAAGRRRRGAAGVGAGAGAAGGDTLPLPDSRAPGASGTPAIGSATPARDDDTSPLGEPRPRVGGSDASTESRGRRHRRRQAKPDEATEPLGQPRPHAGPPRRAAPTEPDAAQPRPIPPREPGAASPERKRQLELPTQPLADTPRDPLPPPEFHLPGDDNEPPPPPPPPPPPNA